MPQDIFEEMRKAPRFELVVPFEERVRHTLGTYKELGENTPELTHLLRHGYQCPPLGSRHVSRTPNLPRGLVAL